ncbi:MAG: YCF48-related protein [Candidatus Moraniibacteriota bacterium]
MKKVRNIITCFFIVSVLTGCSLVGSTPNSATTQKYTFAKNIWISTDAGKTWKDSSIATNKPSVTDIDPLSLVFDPVDAKNIFTGLRTGGIMKSINSGESWEFLTFKTEKIYGLAISPVDSKIIYASTVLNGRGKIFKNTASGATDAWSEIYTSATNGPLVVAMTLDKKNANIIYVATSDNQVLKSLDGGVSWRSFFQAQAPVIKIALDAKDSKLICLLTKSGEVFLSVDGGDKFESLTTKITTTGLFGSGFTVMETDPTNGKWIYLAGKNGIIRSKDAGEKWETITTLNNPENSPVGALAINPQNSQEIMYGALQAIYRSADGGKTWSTSQFDLTKTNSILEYNPQNPNIVVAGFSGK